MPCCTRVDVATHTRAHRGAGARCNVHDRVSQGSGLGWRERGGVWAMFALRIVTQRRGKVGVGGPVDCQGVPRLVNVRTIGRWGTLGAGLTTVVRVAVPAASARVGLALALTVMLVLLLVVAVVAAVVVAVVVGVVVAVVVALRLVLALQLMLVLTVAAGVDVGEALGAGAASSKPHWTTATWGSAHPVSEKITVPAQGPELAQSSR